MNSSHLGGSTAPLTQPKEPLSQLWPSLKLGEQVFNVGCPPRWLGPPCGKSYLEDSRGVLVVVQDGVGVVPLSSKCLELVADLDGNVGKAVPITQL